MWQLLRPGPPQWAETPGAYTRGFHCLFANLATFTGFPSAPVNILLIYAREFESSPFMIQLVAALRTSTFR